MKLFNKNGLQYKGAFNKGSYSNFLNCSGIINYYNTVPQLRSATPATSTNHSGSGSMCIPFVTPDFDIILGELGIQIATPAVATFPPPYITIGVYNNISDNKYNLAPGTLLSQSVFLADTVKYYSYNPNIMLNKNSMYWFCYLPSRSNINIFRNGVDAHSAVLGTQSTLPTTPYLNYFGTVNSQGVGLYATGLQSQYIATQVSTAQTILFYYKAFYAGGK